MLRPDIIRLIVSRDLSQLGLTAEQVQQEDAVLYQAACDQFGTWETALRYAGIRRRRISSPPPALTRDLLRRKIRRLCVMGHNLSTESARRRDRALYDAAIREFGTWRLALEAVGVNLARCRSSRKSRRLHKDQILQALRERQAAGQSLVWSVVCLKDHSLATAAKNAFRSWRQAVRAAGLFTDNRPPAVPE